MQKEYLFFKDWITFHKENVFTLNRIQSRIKLDKRNNNFFLRNHFDFLDLLKDIWYYCHMWVF